ncbi:VTT domain-containing protein [Ignatzschineria rhizosphaerae]|uniref:VTT domain-containing protein n=1 Tax=Ignatzschineria rhizosphaerae TaxID=2923279 RepID=A0ABY3X312_9GAMM|nr:VTT domain-containing protein [Ignatzschineria rhizosphaerae]UNM95101.1 VTT domain-containing protein [Ignatzschineria rhizosphaerae]
MSISVYEGLWLLLLSSFTSSTILPGSSEAALVAFIYHYPPYMISAFWVATVGNTLGSILMLIIGRIFPEKKILSPKVERFIKRYGAWSLLFSSLPIIGDLLPTAAGWLRLNIFYCLITIFIGKAIRYLLVILLLDVTRSQFGF